MSSSNAPDPNVDAETAMEVDPKSVRKRAMPQEQPGERYAELKLEERVSISPILSYST